MTAVPDALLAVGVNCDCGHPLVWRRGHRWCAVYGSHPGPQMGMRNRQAPFSALVDLATLHTYPRRVVT